MSRRLLVLGLDCATPQFVFGPNAFELPNLRALMRRGCWGRLESCHPPITVPAWACMLSGKDPGTLGIYGFRNRRDYSYDNMFTADASAVRQPRVWDILSRHGKRVVVLGVPQTYPVRPVNGWMVAGFLTPNEDAPYTYPRPLKEELRRAVGEYLIDVKDFRTEDRPALLERLYALMENRFHYARHLMEAKPWDFFMVVDMAIDRLHHAFWRFCEPTHPAFVPGNPFEHVFRDFYQAVDARLGELVELAGEDTAVMLVSDHGAKSMVGGVCVNEWLLREGLLTLKRRPERRARIEDCDIDWARTRVWGSGGYYGRMFFNVAGREPEGQVPAAAYETFRDELISRIQEMHGPNGQLLGNRALKPQDIYENVEGVAPDLLVYWGDLGWRSVGSVGFDDIFTFENDTGPDDANHDYHGIFILDDRTGRGGKEIEGLDLLSIAPAMLRLMDVPAPADMRGGALEESLL
ncbi:MAG TPA: alkaline phosphatase family protein [Candidatus Hydrogenedentes bacterium]|nr:alkaline phosphatase family protein [Candidatus Hydrogenedentota bacterium]HQE82652.1 alkaline phosphatase family protein [Candidatus Hydrogenedentota bacterium]HQH53712.1 alkaline phosphatase family protein [Candidatus Hydrogenedentota bacterium]HQM50026.1 alkaline phosphatase family protein [Candidatus Hydrogenedentota bacterium]